MAKENRVVAELAAGFGTGVIAGAAATSALFVYRLATGVPMPQEALAERLVLLLPFPVFAWTLGILQHAAKPLGFAAAVAVSLIGFGVGGMFYLWTARASRRSSLTLGLIAAAVGWGLAVFFILPLIQGGLLGAPLTTVVLSPALPLAIGNLVYGLLLAALTRRARTIPVAGIRSGEAGAASESIGRRVLLRQSALIICMSAAISRLGVLSDGAGAQAARAASRAGRLLGGMPPELTPNSEFFQVSKNFPFDPAVDVRTWSLEVDGLVATPLRLSYAEFVRAAPSVERRHTLMCVSNDVGGDLIGNASWKGIRVRDILALAGIRPDASAVIWRCADGYAESIPRAAALDPEALLAYEMNGERLPRQHGAPVRVLLPDRYGMKQPKWLTGITVAGADDTGYWERRRLSRAGIVKTTSAFRAGTRSGAAVRLGGWAFAGNRAITAVEVSADGGTIWFPATLRPALGTNCWQFWSAEWTPPAPGEYMLAVRAAAAKGGRQSGARRRLPDGAEGYDEVRVRLEVYDSLRRTISPVVVTKRRREPLRPDGSRNTTLP